MYVDEVMSIIDGKIKKRRGLACSEPDVPGRAAGYRRALES
jgi:hypothetical protein